MVVVLGSLYVYLVNGHVPLFADDLCRARPELSFTKAASSAWSEYLGWSGRLPVMFLNHLFFSGDVAVEVLHVMNAVVLALFLYFLLRYLSHRDLVGQAVFLGTFIFLFWFTPTTLGEVLFWKTGAVQYFWGSVLAVVALLPVFLWLVNGLSPGQRSVPMLCAYLAVCFLGGFWVEHVSVSVAAAWMGAYLTAIFTARKVPRPLMLGGLAWCLGTLALLAAPGNYARAEAVGNTVPIQERLIRVTELLPGHLDHKAVALVLVFLTINAVLPSEAYRRQAMMFLLWGALGVISAFATAGAPVVIFHGRVAFFSELCFVLASASLIPYQVFSNKGFRPARLALYGVAAACASLVVVNAAGVYRAYASIAAQERYRQELIEQAKEQGKTEVRLPPLFFTERIHTKGQEVNFGRFFARDITVQPSWKNRCYARFHGLEDVSIASKSN